MNCVRSDDWYIEKCAHAKRWHKPNKFRTNATIRLQQCKWLSIQRPVEIVNYSEQLKDPMSLRAYEPWCISAHVRFLTYESQESTKENKNSLKLLKFRCAFSCVHVDSTESIMKQHTKWLSKHETCRFCSSSPSKLKTTRRFIVMTCKYTNWIHEHTHTHTNPKSVHENKKRINNWLEFDTKNCTNSNRTRQTSTESERKHK